MKKLVLFLMLFASIATYSQDYKRIGNVFIQKTENKAETKTDFVYTDPKGVQYPIYIGKSGACYVYKISSKSGKPYKKYLGEKISREICKELNIEYKSRK